MIGPGYVTPFIYDTETGGVADRAHEPRSSGFPWPSFYETSDCQEYHYLRDRDNTPQRDILSKDSLLASHTTAGVDPEGKHRLWLLFEWRTPWNRKIFHHGTRTLFTRIRGQLVIIKF